MYAKFLTDEILFVVDSRHQYSAVVYSQDEKDGFVPIVTTNKTTDVELPIGFVYGVLFDRSATPATRTIVAVKETMRRTFSKLKAVAVLMKAGYWSRCKQYIEDAGLYDLYLAAQDFREDNEYFVQGLAKIKAELGLTDDQVEAILSQCVAD